MSQLIVRRTPERTTSPQPVYPLVVDQTVRTWLPATALLLATFVTPAGKKLDVCTDWAPQTGWLNAVVDAGIQRTLPASTAELASFRTADGPKTDIRATSGAPTSFSIAVEAVDPIVRTWQPAFYKGERVASRVTRFEPTAQDNAGWIYSALTPPVVTTAQTWPAMASELASFRTPAAATVDVRRFEPPGFVSPAVDASVSTWHPAFYKGELIRARAQRFEPTAPDTAGAFTAALTPPALTVAQQLPVFVAELAGFRTRSGPALDVRSVTPPGFEWVRQANDDVVETWQPAFASELASFRTAAAARVDVRRFEPPGFTSPAVDATVARWAPASAHLLAAFRTPARRVLDVRSQEWATSFGITPLVDARVRTWMPAATAELASFLAPRRAQYDVRGVDWTSFGSWTTTNPPTTFARPATVYGIAVDGTTQRGIAADSSSAVGIAADRTIAIGQAHVGTELEGIAVDGTIKTGTARRSE